MQTSRVIVKVEELSVFCDLRIQGFGDVMGGKLFTEDDGELSFRFGHSLISDYTKNDVCPHTVCKRVYDEQCTGLTSDHE